MTRTVDFEHSPRSRLLKDLEIAAPTRRMGERQPASFAGLSAMVAPVRIVVQAPHGWVATLLRDVSSSWLGWSVVVELSTTAVMAHALVDGRRI